MGDSNKMDKLHIKTYDLYSNREMLDKRSFPEWVEQNKNFTAAQLSNKSIKRAKFGNEVKGLMDGVEFDVSVSDRKESHKSFYIEPTVHRRQVQQLSPYL